MGSPRRGKACVAALGGVGFLRFLRFVLQSAALARSGLARLSEYGAALSRFGRLAPSAKNFLLPGAAEQYGDEYEYAVYNQNIISLPDRYGCSASKALSPCLAVAAVSSSSPSGPNSLSDSLFPAAIRIRR